ncbi:MAG: alpha/beta hydrolase family esterase [Sinimarinibacterium flocculans]|uniref:extracellular catalytic domain type 1 short-chain-length polyhydroxyalkanoate depolymerase n=1 Tax=Sinimarinibacterium flocculans TaxID=985250 RepID=UPI003C51EB48
MNFITRVVALLTLLSAPVAMGGTLTHHTDQTLEYWVFTPSSYDGSQAYPLVVYLHGCNQTAPDVAVGTRWNAIAEAHDALVVYPAQRSGFIAPLTAGNATRCWNFQSPGDIVRERGEAKLIADVTRHVIAAWNVDADRVFVSGASAGGAMVPVMAATYPDLFAAAAVLAGCPYAACTDTTGAAAFQAMGAHARMVPMMIVHGTADEVTAYPLGEALVQEWLGVADLSDDGLMNHSVSRGWAAIENYGWNAPSPFSGDACVYPGAPNRFPCPGGLIGFPGTYPYTVRRYVDAIGRSIVDFWIIHFAGHGYVGGDPAGSFTDPLGPDITSAVWAFFAAHPR